MRSLHPNRRYETKRTLSRITSPGHDQGGPVLLAEPGLFRLWLPEPAITVQWRAAVAMLRPWRAAKGEIRP